MFPVVKSLLNVLLATHITPFPQNTQHEHYSTLLTKMQPKKPLFLIFSENKKLLRKIPSKQLTNPYFCATILMFDIGMSPSGKAQDFDSCIRWFEPSHPSQKCICISRCIFYPICRIGMSSARRAAWNRRRRMASRTSVYVLSPASFYMTARMLFCKFPLQEAFFWDIMIMEYYPKGRCLE